MRRRPSDAVPVREDYSQEPAAALTNIVGLQLLIILFFFFSSGGFYLCGVCPMYGFRYCRTCGANLGQDRLALNFVLGCEFFAYSLVY
ncbi:MAG: hypothetical protein RIS47_2046 [Bacteroidota bacterium]